MLKQISFNPERQVYDYKVLNDEGNEVGMAQLRFEPSKSAEMPAGFESHIYYEIFPAHRNQGWGNKTLKALLDEAKARGIEPVILTVDTQNSASIKIVEKNHGELVERSKTSSGREVLKYRVVK